MNLYPSTSPYDLARFVKAQAPVFEQAIRQLREGNKRSHWIWFVFPQVAGLGRSSTAMLYAIAGLDEARAYLRHPLLGPRLIEACEAILAAPSSLTARDILGSPDDLKLRSSATLFAAVSAAGSAFDRILDRFCNGQADEMTLSRLGLSKRDMEGRAANGITVPDDSEVEIPGGDGFRLSVATILDSEDMAASRRTELDIPRDVAARLGESAVEAARSGIYRNAVSENVDWHRQTQAAIANKVSISPGSPLPAFTQRVHPETQVEITNETTLGAARRLHDSGLDPLALNLANGLHPGGGFLSGARAQEEALCRSSALYLTLENDPMYAGHAQRSLPDSTEWCILSPEVPVFRDDAGLPLDAPWQLSFITCAAPVAHRVGQPLSGDLLQQRIQRVLAAWQLPGPMATRRWSSALGGVGPSATILTEPPGISDVPSKASFAGRSQRSFSPLPIGRPNDVSSARFGRSSANRPVFWAGRIRKLRADIIRRDAGAGFTGEPTSRSCFVLQVERRSRGIDSGRAKERDRRGIQEVALRSSPRRAPCSWPQPTNLETRGLVSPKLARR